LSDPKGEKPHPDHPHEDEFEFEMHEHAAEQAADVHSGDAPHPLDELGIHASSEEFHFSGPAEELDFTEPADFTFPTEHVETEASSDSSAEFPAHEHAELDHLFGGDEAAHHEAAVGEHEAAEVEPVAVATADEAKVEEEPKPKRKREVPASIRALEWVAVCVLAAIGLIAPFVGIFALNDPDTVSLIVNICFPMLMLLVPYALWRSSRRWTTPAASALYTVLLGISVAALLGGTWVEGMELSQMKWQFNKSRVDAGKPRPKPVPVVETPAPAPTEQK
jgi:hypothetical protein